MSWKCKNCSTENEDSLTFCRICFEPAPSVVKQAGDSEKKERTAKTKKCPICDSSYPVEFVGLCKCGETIFKGLSDAEKFGVFEEETIITPPAQKRLFIREVASFRDHNSGVCYPKQRAEEFLTDRIEIYNDEVFGKFQCPDPKGRHLSISGEHCKFSCEDGEWYVTELKNTYGTLFNRKRMSVGEKQKICDTDQVQFGGILFYFYMGE